MSLKHALFALFIPLAAAAAGCTPTARLETPAGFASLDRDDTFAYRATSAKGVVLATRSEKNDLRGNVDFWAESVDLRLAERGYKRERAVEVRARGLEGRQLRYTLSRGAREHRYWVTVFLHKDRVLLVEAAGDSAHFAAAEPAVERAIASLRID